MLPLDDTPPHARAQAAFAAARKGFERHRGADVATRLAALGLLKRRILESRERIVERVMAEVGKCRTDALIAEIIGALDWIDWLERHAAALVAPRRVPTPITLLGKTSLLRHEALGVVLVICPWNYPFHNAVTAIAAAVAAGNAVIYKPSEHAACQGLVEEMIAGIPLLEALVHVVYGDGETGSALIAQGPAKIFFTGSGRTGARIMAQASAQLIPVDLELGGKDAMIVFADAAGPRAAAGALWGACTNAGQSCSGVERLLVEAEAFEPFMELLVEQAGRLVVAPGDRGGSDIGRMTVGFQRDIVRAHVEEALAKGARLRFGRVPSPDTLVVAPVILDRVTPDMAIWREETFGPVLPVMAFRDEAEALSLADTGDYGLNASVFSADMTRAMRVASALEVGGVSINNVNMSEGNPGLPFGGAKKSGHGRLRGPEGLLGFTRSKAILIDKASEKIEANWYPYTPEKFARFDRFLQALYSGGGWRTARVAKAGHRLESFSQKARPAPPRPDDRAKA